jgi:divalent metal cation (Fe/Co/Zn/Cd) transporter
MRLFFASSSMSTVNRSSVVQQKAALWLQGITLSWMLVELAVSMYAALTTHSPALLAFGSDSLVEVLSATVVILQWLPRFSVPERRAAQIASVLLFVLAVVVTGITAASFILKQLPGTSCAGIGITAAALVVMPLLAWAKRREARRSGNRALAADAVQSATCAYLALITLCGLASHATFDVAWFDPLAALVAVPILVKEGKDAWRGHNCGCC